jgi:ribonucleotide monophosphatase NagD (HAD superfamily)
VLVGKPAAAYFVPLLKELGVSSTESVMVGDSMATDIAGAANVGMRAILVADDGGAAGAATGVTVISSLDPLGSMCQVSAT